MTAPGFASTTRAVAFKTAMRDRARILLPEVQVSWGHPGNQYASELLAVMDIVAEQEPATLSPRRGRDEVLALGVVAVVTLQGSDDAAQEAAENRAVEMIAAIEEYVRITDTTVDGSVQWCALTRLDIEGFTPDEERALGWRSQVIATFTAKARITS